MSAGVSGPPPGGVTTQPGEPQTQKRPDAAPEQPPAKPAASAPGTPEGAF